VAAFLRSVVDAAHVSDVLQQVAVKLVRNFDRYDAERPFTPWAIGIAKNEVLAWRRQQATDRHRFSDEIVQRVADAFAETSAAEQPRREALQECLKQVDGRGRTALDLYYGQGGKSADVAKAMQLTNGALRMLLCRVREAIRRCIQQRLDAEGGV
jgi:RNA polymerase sigma-70 factor (ECF subfamily)